MSAQPTSPPIATPRGDWNWRWLCLIPTVLILLMSVLMRVEGEHQVHLPLWKKPLPPSCTAQLLFGIPCPSCGMTRGMISMGHGNWQQAWHFNPAALLLFTFLVLLVPWHLYQLARLRSGRPPWGNLWNFSPLILILIAMVAQWLVKLRLLGVI